VREIVGFFLESVAESRRLLDFFWRVLQSAGECWIFSESVAECWRVLDCFVECFRVREIV